MTIQRVYANIIIVSKDNKNLSPADQSFQGQPVEELKFDNLVRHYNVAGRLKVAKAMEPTHVGGDRKETAFELPVYDMPSLIEPHEMVMRTGINGALKALIMIGRSGSESVWYGVVANGGRHSEGRGTAPIWFRPEGGFLASPNRVHLVAMARTGEGDFRVLTNQDRSNLISRGIGGRPVEIGRHSDDLVERDFPTSDQMSSRHALVSFDHSSGSLLFQDAASLNGTTFWVPKGGEMLVDGRRQENSSRLGHLALKY